MHADKLSKHWLSYREREIDKTLHPDDHMFNTAVNGWADYNFVGLSAVQMISSVCHNVPWHQLRRVMDFGCGHGRVARHLRGYLPNAELFFVDIDRSCTDFCAAQFGGTGIVSKEDFAAVDLPADMDLIWVGSVFTHLDYGRMNALFDLLVKSLRPNGVLVATFRGEHMFRHHLAADNNQREKWKDLMNQYRAGGIGYAPYKPSEPDWGLSLSSIERVIGIGRRHSEIRLVNYTEVGWASAHDVGAWMKLEQPTVT